MASAIAFVLLVVLLVSAWRSKAALTGDLFWETVPFLLLAVPTVWETYLVLAIPLTFLVVRRAARGELADRWPLLVAFAFMSIGLFPGLPPALHTSAVAQIFGYSLPMYGLVAIAVSSLALGDRPFDANGLFRA